MGSATAYNLARLDPSLRVVVVEKDPSYRYSSTLLSDGNVRIQFNLEENIRISQYGFEVMETFAEDIDDPAHDVYLEAGTRGRRAAFAAPDATYRPLTAADPIDVLPEWIAEAVEIAQIRGSVVFSVYLQRFLQRGLPLPGRRAYPAVDAALPPPEQRLPPPDTTAAATTQPMGVTGAVRPRKESRPVLAKKVPAMSTPSNFVWMLV